MERLTERLTDKSYCISDIRAIQKETFYEDMECRRGFDLYTGKAIDKLAEYEDLEEQGKLLKLPVAVGTWVYEVYRFMDEGVCEIDVHKIKLEDLENIGKTVFLTIEEAEDKLAEMEGEEANERRVIIYISATKQTTTAKWHLEGVYPSDLWVAILHDISDLKPFLGESKVIIKFSDRTREAVFYFSGGKLIQAGQNELDFWVKKSEKESEEKSMLHNVTVKHEEDKVLEEFWVMRAVKEGKLPFDFKKTVIDERKLDHEPSKSEIAQFLADSKADFVSVVQNYRFENELPF